MKIGIDIDDTLVDTSKSLDELLQKYNIDFKRKYKNKWTRKEKNFIFSNYLEEMLVNAKIKKDVREVLDNLNFLGHELIIITARNNKYCAGIEEFTLKFLKYEKINVSKVYFRQSIKCNLAKQLKLDLMIDDDVRVYNNMKKENIVCILFGDNIKTWKEVLQYIKEKEE